MNELYQKLLLEVLAGGKGQPAKHRLDVQLRRIMAGKPWRDEAELQSVLAHAWSRDSLKPKEPLGALRALQQAGVALEVTDRWREVIGLPLASLGGSMKLGKRYVVKLGALVYTNHVYGQNGVSVFSQEDGTVLILEAAFDLPAVRQHSLAAIGNNRPDKEYYVSFQAHQVRNHGPERVIVGWFVKESSKGAWEGVA